MNGYHNLFILSLVEKETPEEGEGVVVLVGRDYQNNVLYLVGFLLLPPTYKDTKTQLQCCSAAVLQFFVGSLAFSTTAHDTVHVDRMNRRV